MTLAPSDPPQPGGHSTVKGAAVLEPGELAVTNSQPVLTEEAVPEKLPAVSGYKILGVCGTGSHRVVAKARPARGGMSPGVGRLWNPPVSAGSASKGVPGTVAEWIDSPTQAVIELCLQSPTTAESFPGRWRLLCGALAVLPESLRFHVTGLAQMYQWFGSSRKTPAEA